MVKRVNAGDKKPAAASGSSGVPGADIDRYGTGVAGFPAPHPRMQVHLDPDVSPVTEADQSAPIGIHRWRIVLLLGWVGGILGYSTVWAVSRQIGLPTWWLGSPSQPAPLYIVSLPFLLPALMLLAIAINLKRLPLLGILAACASSVIAAGDAGTQPGLAMIQAAISVGLLSTSLAALLGSSAARSKKEHKPAPAR
jgi:hypothetical protein